MSDNKPDAEIANKQTAIERYIARLDNIENIILVALIAIMAILAIAQILLRNFFHSGMVWAEPMMRSLVLWVAMVGAMVATRENKHICIDVLNNWLSDRSRGYVSVLTQAFASFVCFIIAWHSLRFVMQEAEQTTMAFAFVPTWIVTTVIPVSFLVMAVRFGLYAIRRATDK